MILIEKIRSQLRELAEDMECEMRDLASTLLFTAVRNGNYILCHIGDGVLGYLKDGELKVASKPENGEFANTTVFTTSKDVMYSMRLIKGQLGSIDGFVMMSDGTEAGLYNKRENKLAPALLRIMNLMVYMRSDVLESQLTDSFYNVVRNTTTDDCSIVIMRNDHNICYNNMSRTQKAELLNLNKNSASLSRQIKSHDRIFGALEKEQPINRIARISHIQMRYLKPKVDKLVELNLIEVKNRQYSTIIKL